MSHWKKEFTIVKGTWDFAVDGGAQGDFPMFTLPANSLVHDIVVHIETIVVTAGLLEVGDEDDQNGYVTDFIASMGAVGVVTDEQDLGAYMWDATNKLKKFNAAAKVVDLTIGTADATAGKINVYAVVQQL